MSQKGLMMQLYDFTVPELNKFRELCNFSDDELFTVLIKDEERKVHMEAIERRKREQSTASNI